jgi:GntR family transcriptional regulator
MPQPLYREVAESLRNEIATGALAPGDQLPSEPELEQRFGVSRNTVRLALAALANEGLVEPRQGRGTYVREWVTFTVPAPVPGVPEGAKRDEFVSSAEAGRRVPDQRNLRVEVRTASPEVAARLEIEEGSGVVVRAMELLLDGRPWSVQESYYPMEIAQGTPLLQAENIAQGTVRELADHGYVQVGYRDEVVTRMPSQREATTLGAGPGVPVLELFRTAYSTERPIRLTITVYTGDSTRLAYEIGDVSARRGEG